MPAQFNICTGGSAWAVQTENESRLLDYLGIIVIGQLFITEIAYEFFNVEPMLHTLDWSFNPSGALDLVIIVAASSLVLWVREIYRLFKR